METNKKEEHHIKRGVNWRPPNTEYKKLQKKLSRLEKEYNEVAPFGIKVRSERIVKKAKSVMKRMGELAR